MTKRTQYQQYLELNMVLYWLLATLVFPFPARANTLSTIEFKSATFEAAEATEAGPSNGFIELICSLPEASTIVVHFKIAGGTATPSDFAYPGNVHDLEVHFLPGNDRSGAHFYAIPDDGLADVQV